MTIIAVHATCVSHRDHRCDLSLDPATLQLELPESRGDRAIVELHQLGDDIGEGHTSIMTKGCISLGLTGPPQEFRRSDTGRHATLCRW